MNTYGSIIRTLTARNVLEKVIAPPASLSIARGDWVPQIAQDGLQGSGVPYWKTGTNIVLRSVGLFSNFADGFVWGTPSSRLKIRIDAIPYLVAPPSMVGTSMQWDADSKTMTGIGTDFLTSLPAAGIVIKHSTGGAASPILGVTAAPASSDTSVAMTDYGPGGVMPAGTMFVAQVPPVSIKTYMLEVSQLNQLFAHEMFMPASLLGGNLTSFFLKASVIQGEGNIPAAQDLALLTKSIDTAFAGDTAFFDVRLEVEMTSNGTI